MSYAVIQTGGKQYKVKSGEILKIEKLADSKPNSKIEFKEILAYGDDKIIEVGSPTVTGAKVEADLIKNDKNRTVLIFKKRIILLKQLSRKLKDKKLFQSKEVGELLPLELELDL